MIQSLQMYHFPVIGANFSFFYGLEVHKKELGKHLNIRLHPFDESQFSCWQLLTKVTRLRDKDGGTANKTDSPA